LKKLIVNIFLFVIYATNIFAQNSVYEYFINANRFYIQGNYDKAIELYKRILKEDIKNGYIYYNIGTCYLKENKIGKSLYYFNLARFYIPLNRRLRKNILIAKSKLKDEFPSKIIYEYLDKIFIFSKIFSEKTLFFLMISTFYLFIFSLIFRSRVIHLVIFLAFLILGVNFGWDYFYIHHLNFGYVINKNVPVFSDISKNSKIILKANDGDKIYILKKHNNFLYVEFINGLKGWILNKDAIYNNEKL